HRLNACGYALGARFSPSWMEPQMFHAGGTDEIGADQVYFLHMIIMDSDTGTAMSLGRTSLVTGAGAEPLSALPLEMTVR
ncbi:MAG: aminopeptidase P family protein, partial [Pseudomonadota bacterium]